MSKASSGKRRPKPAGLHIEILQDETDRLGPGKVRLLELIRDKGSISEAAQAMNMSYRRAWLLANALNKMFAEPLYETRIGGQGRGGARLTARGEAVIAHYRAFESECRDLLAGHAPLQAE